jgi:hypothetical protein
MKYDVANNIDKLLKNNNVTMHEKVKQFIQELSESGIDELNGFTIKRVSHDFSNIKDIKILSENVYENFYIAMNADVFVFDRTNLYIYYDANSRESLTHFSFKVDDDYVEFEVEEETSKRFLKLYIMGGKVLINRGHPSSGNPDFVCEIEKKHNADEYSDCYYVTDPSHRITDDDKPIRFGIGDNVEEELRPQDMQSEVRTLRAIGERVCELYHEKYLWDRKARVLSKGKMGQVKLEG